MGDGEGDRPDRDDPDEPPVAGGRAQADRELRLAVLVAVPVLLAGQVVLVNGWWPVAVLISGGGTAVAVVLARRWQRLSAADRPPGPDGPPGPEDP